MRDKGIYSFGYKKIWRFSPLWNNEGTDCGVDRGVNQGLDREIEKSKADLQGEG